MAPRKVNIIGDATAAKRELAVRLLTRSPRGKLMQSSSGGGTTTQTEAANKTGSGTPTNSRRNPTKATPTRQTPPRKAKRKLDAIERLSTEEEAVDIGEAPDSDAELNSLSGGKRTRGAVTMQRITQRKMLGDKPEVLFNALGQPVGATASEMQSFIGALVRRRILITRSAWTKVTNNEKNKIWQSVQVY